MKQDVKKHIHNTIIAQNAYLKMLQDEPISSKYQSSAYLTKQGKAKIDPDFGNLMLNGDAEMQNPQFYDDNKYWLMDEVEKYMDENKRQIEEREKEAAEAEDAQNNSQDDSKTDPNALAGQESEQANAIKDNDEQIIEETGKA